MNFFQVLVTAHVTGIILWIGGAFVAATLVRMEIDSPAHQSPAIHAARERVFRKIAGRGMMLAILAGIAIVLDRPIYLKQGWFHAKMTMAVLAIGLHMAIRSVSKKMDKGHSPDTSHGVYYLQLGMGAAAVAALLLVFTQAF
jgi:protoporphyrinogen IX oxidase